MPKKFIPYKPLKWLVFEQLDDEGNKVRDIDFIFNNYALTTFVEQFGDIGAVVKDYEKKPYDLTAIILYCGVVNNQADFTLDDAKAEFYKNGIPKVCAKNLGYRKDCPDEPDCISCWNTQMEE